MEENGDVSECNGQNGGPLSPPTTIAAMKVQKVYRSYRTRRMLADSAVVAEELWWQALDFARLNHSTISFFDFLKPESPHSRWNRVGLNASKVGKGLSKDDKAQKLAFQHWIEAIDPRHRYGHSLHKYYEEWCKSNAGQPFFYWLDLGDGRDVDLKECPRAKLRQQCIKYLGPQEREYYEYVVEDGKLLNKMSMKPLDTSIRSSGSKYIFVMGTTKKLYAGEKKKGLFHHSSFLAGGATLAAGRLEATDGVLKSISPYSGHYKPTDECLGTFMSILKEHGLNLDKVEILKANEDYETSGSGILKSSSTLESLPSDLAHEEKAPSSETPEAAQAEAKVEYKRTLSGGLQSPRAEVPKTVMLQRMNSKKSARSFQLGNQLSLKWSTGAGPRIGCIADYPVELRLQALEMTSLSPRSSPRRIAALVSPSGCPTPLGGSSSTLESLPSDLAHEEKAPSSETPEAAQAEAKVEYKRTLSGGLQSPRAEVPKTVMLQRMNSKKSARSFQLGNQLSLKWSTGAGPRIGCIADYPVELRLQALEMTSLSPRSSPRRIAALVSPSGCPTPLGGSSGLPSPLGGSSGLPSPLGGGNGNFNTSS